MFVYVCLWNKYTQTHTCKAMGHHYQIQMNGSFPHSLDKHCRFFSQFVFPFIMTHDCTQLQCIKGTLQEAKINLLQTHSVSLEWCRARKDKLVTMRGQQVWVLLTHENSHSSPVIDNSKRVGSNMSVYVCSGLADVLTFLSLCHHLQLFKTHKQVLKNLMSSQIIYFSSTGLYYRHFSFI